jgi:hypothetical protein
VDASSSTPTKRRRGHPLGCKNKVKISAIPTDTVKHLDVSCVQPVLRNHLMGFCSPFSLLPVPNVVNNSAFL